MVFQNLFGEMKKPTTRKNYLLPRLSIESEIKESRINFNYFTNVDEPDIQQLQHLLDNRNPFNLYQGNPDLTPSYNHILSARFMNYNSFSFRSVFGFFNARYTNNAIAYSRTISENYVTSLKPINVDYNFQTRASLTYGQPIPYTKAKFELKVNGQYLNGITMINGVEHVNQQIIGGASLRLGNRKKDNFDLSFIGGLDYTDSKYSNSDVFNVSYFTTSLGLNLEVNFSDNLSFDTDYGAKLYSQERFSTSSEVHLLNASLQWKIGKTARWIVDFEVNDVFNAGLGVYRNASLGGITETQSNQLGRYGMVKITYSLSNFSPKSGGGWF